MLVFLFTDIEGSTRLWEEHTPVMTGVIAHHDEILRSVVRDQGAASPSTPAMASRRPGNWMDRHAAHGTPSTVEVE
jgi:class 3 adenylate cyclase